jgi:hypothetical protein
MSANGFLQMQAVTNYVRPVMWVGQCPRCGEDSPEMRDSPRAAQGDVDNCPCRDVHDENAAQA